MSKFSFAKWSTQLKATKYFLGILHNPTFLLFFDPLRRFSHDQLQHFLSSVDMHANFVVLAILQKL